jgi:hypothetical protein
MRYFDKHINFYITGRIPVRQFAELAGCCSESVAACTWAKPEHMCAPEHVCNSAFIGLQGRFLKLMVKTGYIILKTCKEDEVGGVCGTHEREEICIQDFGGKT